MRVIGHFEVVPETDCGQPFEITKRDRLSRPHHPDRLHRAAPLRPDASDVAVLSTESGYIRYIDKKRVIAAAKHYHVSIRVLRRVGQFVPAGIPLAMVSKGNRLPPAGAAELLAAFDIGPTRTLQQDVEFGVLQIVDIALRAISPAVNDPTTAINCVDQLSRILIHFASREPPDDLLYDPLGIVRARARRVCGGTPDRAQRPTEVISSAT